MFTKAVGRRCLSPLCYLWMQGHPKCFSTGTELHCSALSPVCLLSSLKWNKGRSPEVWTNQRYWWSTHLWLLKSEDQDKKLHLPWPAQERAFLAHVLTAVLASCEEALCAQLPKTHLGEKQCAHKCIWVALFEKVHARSRNSYKKSPEISGNLFRSGSIL